MKRNKFVGQDAGAFFAEEARKDPEFAAALKAEVDRLELARADRLELAHQVRKLRERLGLTQAELAKRVGTKQPGIARIESGRVVPRLDLLQKIAVAAGCKLQVRFIALDKRAR